MKRAPPGWRGSLRFAWKGVLYAFSVLGTAVCHLPDPDLHRRGMGGVHLDHQALDDLQRHAMQIWILALWIAILVGGSGVLKRGMRFLEP
ncbi:protein of unknown function [Azospirillum baldaniorum]|uniref:Uncharacterized protein n=1 Tax=Azospirillum baldaniorum TaxID=1064539 RepID=A0A9P1NM91_9PROT|nr:protein of unknown function [Azospirillum baldaniorum]